MERRAILAGMLSVVATPLAAAGQPPGKPARLGILYGSKPDFTPESDPVERGFRGRTGGARLCRGPGRRDRVPECRGETRAVPGPRRRPRPGARRCHHDGRHGHDHGGVGRHAHHSHRDGRRGESRRGRAHRGVRPTGRREVTGVTLETAEVTAKRVELLQEALPSVRRIGALYRAARRSFPVVAQWLRDSEAAARQFGLSLEHIDMGSEPSGWARVLQEASRRGIGAATIIESPTYYVHRAPLAQAALKARLAVMTISSIGRLP
jgi:hypothetical protein